MKSEPTWYSSYASGRASFNSIVAVSVSTCRVPSPSEFTALGVARE